MESMTTRDLVAYAAVVLLSALAGFAAIYVTLGGRDNGGRKNGAAIEHGAAHKTEPSMPNGGRLNIGEMTAFVFKRAPEALPEIAFSDGEGRARTLKDWQGKVVLLNLWATWCAPCRKEMPALARLQQALGSERFEVVALAVDRVGADGARKFLEQTGAAALRLYVDATARAGTELRAAGMPTTILIDRQGREIGRLTGPAEWDSEDAKRLIQAVLTE